MICPPPLPGADRSPLAAEPAPTAAEGDITIRALTADDRAVVERLHQQLSSTDAHLRFFGPRPKHLGDFADQLCCQDFKHLALGAFENGELVGVAITWSLTPPRVASAPKSPWPYPDTISSMASARYSSGSSAPPRTFMGWHA